MENVSTKSITPLIKLNETQIILQRHCEYNRQKGKLIKDSIELQKKL